MNFSALIRSRDDPNHTEGSINGLRHPTRTCFNTEECVLNY